MPREVRAIGPSHPLNDSQTGIQRTINMDVLSAGGPGEDSTLVLKSAPGLLADKTYTSEQVLRLYTAERLLLAFTKTSADVLKVYGYAAGSGTRPAASGPDLGWPTLTQSAGSGTVGSLSWYLISVAHGQNQVVVVDGTKGWVLAYSDSDVTGITEITSPNWLGSYSVSHIDGYYIFIKPNSEIWYWSQIDDASDLSALSFSSADGAPDRLIVSAVVNGVLYLFGERTCEPWVLDPTGGDPPFVRVNGARMNVGCVGTQAVKNITFGLAFVGMSDSGGPHVYTLTGYQYTKISNEAVDQYLAKVRSPFGIYLYTYQEDGAEFICIKDYDDSGLTWVYNTSTRQWCERGEYTTSWGAHRVRFTAHIDGRTYAAGYGESSGANGKLYRMGRQYHDLNGTAMMRERTWPHLVGPEAQAIRYHGLNLLCTSGPDQNGGEITLEISNDYGDTFGSPVARALGATGRATERISWHGLGTCPAGGSRVFRLRSDENMPLTIRGAVLNAKL